MFAHVKDSANVVKSDSPIVVDIQSLVVCSLDEVESELAGLSSDGSHELVIADFAVSISVECLEQQIGFVLIDDDAKVKETPSEVVNIQRA